MKLSLIPYLISRTPVMYIVDIHYDKRYVYTVPKEIRPDITILGLVDFIITDVFKCKDPNQIIRYVLYSKIRYNLYYEQTLIVTWNLLYIHPSYIDSIK